MHCGQLFAGKLIVYQNNIDGRIQHPCVESSPSGVKFSLNCPVAQLAISRRHWRNRIPFVFYSAKIAVPEPSMVAKVQLNRY